MKHPLLAAVLASCAASLLAAGCGDRGADTAATAGAGRANSARPSTVATPPPSAEAQQQMSAIEKDASMPEQAKAMSMNRVMSQEQQRR